MKAGTTKLWLKRLTGLTALVAGLIVLSSPVFSPMAVFGAQTNKTRTFRCTPACFTPLHDSIKQGLTTSWSSSRPCSGAHPAISFLVGDDGKMYEPAILNYSDDEQYNAECLEAVCSLTPFAKGEPYSNTTMRIEHYCASFDGTDGIKPAYNGTEIAKYYAAHPGPTGKNNTFVLIHKIPLTVLTRYPGLFSKEELQSTDNLLEVPVGIIENEAKAGSRNSPPQYATSIANLYAHWNELVKDKNLNRSGIEHFGQRAHILAR